MPAHKSTLFKTSPRGQGSSRSVTSLFLVLFLTGALTGCSGTNGYSDYSGTSGYNAAPRPARASSVRGVSVKPEQDGSSAQTAFRLVNDERARRGMRTLTRRADLDAVAYAHARDLLRMNRLTHVSSDGRQLENRLARLDWEWAGENLARNKGYESPANEAVAGWVASPKHFENMFRPDFTQTGMAALYDPDSGFTYFVQVFVTPV